MSDQIPALTTTNQHASPASLVDPNRLNHFRQTALFLLAAAVFATVFYAILGLATGVWQMAVVAGFISAGIICLTIGYRAARRGQFDPAGYLVLLGLALAYGGPELLWSGATLYLAINGLIVISLVGTFLLPHRPWFIAAGLFSVFMWLANRVSLWPRYDYSQLSFLNLFISFITFVLVAVSLWQILRGHLNSLRTKVIVAFLTVTLSAVGTVVFFSDLTNRASLTANVGANLKTLAREKASTIEALLGRQIDILEVLALSNNVRASVIRANAAYSPTSDLPAIRNAIAQRDVAWTIAPENDPLVQDTLTSAAARELQEFRARFPDNAEILVTDKYGATIAATNRTAKYDQAEQAWWQGVYHDNQDAIYVSQPDFNRNLATFGIIIAVSIRSPDSPSIEGVLYALYRIEAITAELGAERFGQTGQTGLLLDRGQILTPDGIITVSSEDLQQLTAFMTVDYAVFNYGGAPQLVSQAPVVPAATGRLFTTDLGWRLVVTQSPDEALEPVFATGRTTVIVGVATLALTAVLAVGVAQLLSRPIIRLTAVAARIAAGDLTAQALVESRDEIGALAATFNEMTARLHNLIGSLETQAQTRIKELRASADVGQAAASVLDPDQLLRAVVNLITARFGFYYTAVFTLDEIGRYAVLREATGEAGQTLKERHHQLEVGGQSMVGQVTAHRQASIAHDVGAEAVRFNNPLLPNTRSEIVLPLIVGDRVLGALDVQSAHAAAFDEAGATMLQSMADQIAVALSNAEQFKQTDTALQQSRDLYAASQSLNAADQLSDVLAALISHIAPDASRAGLLRFGPRRADGQLTYVEFVAEWVHPDFRGNPKIQPIPIGTRFTPQQMPLVNYVAPGQPFIVPDGSDPALDLPVRDLMQHLGGQALAALPLTVGQHILGIIAVGYRAPRQFKADQLQVMQTLTGHAAIVLQNLQAVADTHEALAQLDAVNRRLTGAAWDDFTRRRAASSVRWIGTTDRAQPTDLPEVAEALSTGQITTRPLNGSGQLGVAVPIKLRDVSIGALQLVVPQTAWNEELRATLDSIAGHVAQAAENARLLEVTEERFTRERALGEATDRIRHRTEVKLILETAAQELAQYLQASVVRVRLGASEGASEPAATEAGRPG
jgi:GAF domain-containing protein/HAMP domain-containing protein